MSTCSTEWYTEDFFYMIRRKLWLWMSPHFIYFMFFFSSPWDAHMCSKKCNFIEILFNIFCHCAHSYTSIRLYFLLIKKKVFHQKKTGGTNADACQVKESLNSLNSFLKHLAFHFTTFQLDLQKKKKKYKENKLFCQYFHFPLFLIFTCFLLNTATKY